MKTFIISDTHVNHDNVIKYSQRPFNNVSEMNEALIANWNSVVRPQDMIWHLGDVFYPPKSEHHISLDELGARLNGKKYLVCGNHDRERLSPDDTNINIREHWMWESVQDYAEFKFGKDRFILMHYPIESWRNAHRGWYHLHGHLHTPANRMFIPTAKWYKPHRMDVGVDGHFYTPWDLEEIRDTLAAQKDYDPQSHHSE